MTAWKWWPIRSLRGTILLSFVLIAALTAAAAAGATALRARQVVLEQVQESAVTQLRSNVEAFAPDLRVEPDQRLLSFLARQLRRGADSSDSTFGATYQGMSASDRSGPTVPESLLDAARTSLVSLSQRVQFDSASYLAVAVPVLTGSEPGGESPGAGVPSGLVVSSMTPLAQQEAVIGRIIGGSIAAALPGVIISILLALLVTGALLRPIRRLHAAVEQVSSGELGAQVADDDRGEVGDLARAFNSMSRDLRTEHDALRAMEERARRFTADVSHELRTPLSAMTAVVGVLADSHLTGDTAEAAQLVARETVSLARLVEDLIEISRFDAGTAELQRDEIDLSLLVQHTLALRGWAERVENTVSPGLRAQVDPRRLDVVLANLIGNATRHAGPTARIVVNARAEGSRLLIEVIDDGPGIPSELRPHVFDRFVKGDPARERSAGSGLGLSIALENVVLHGGTLRVESTDGTRFIVELPGVVP
ncbi:sensor histidine kinase [Rathayibacter toxicus]|uniref:histidine kinase n=2 Tax=Rathayibacter toxicus TaxID=145458 RepID=A0A2S5Y9B4_9MICO|nr:HAMP domain-containing sensor histidine kinase [Rathayibacter toxicus]PPH25068.1 sensor histidine kinase [Rathayibacter toxicus]PPH58995.1 sensor histidine kinase [Rathayibacter toxicus]PPH60989.1 sensor histidine kinase [Rathayibacter toxicus]PPH88810.1 sensor histidine kinase [Rathayibacter toxicus]PPI16501.1 sensor histidine kinase [Rathayibacter toxicus]